MTVSVGASGQGGTSTALWGLMSASTSAELISALRRVLEPYGVDGLFVVDHSVSHLVAVDGATTIAVDDAMLGPLFELSPFESVDGRVLTPLVDLEFPVMVARSSDTDIPPDIARLCGEIVSRRLTTFDGLESCRRRSQVSLAAKLQWDFLPTKALKVGPFRAAGTLEPAHDVAGDAFDLGATPDDEALAAASLDAMGHGLEAALSASVALAGLRNAREDGASLAEQVGVAHRAVQDHWHGDRFVTMAAVEVTPESIRVVNAGHEPLRRLSEGRVRRLSIPAAPPLGVAGSHEHTSHEIEPLELGEALVMLSDGVPSARPSGGQRLGSDGADGHLAVGGSESPLLIAHRMVRHVVRHAAGTLTDDLTAVVVRRATAPAS